MSLSSTLPDAPLSYVEMPGDMPVHTALVLLWSRAEPHRVGEVCFVPHRAARAPWVLGREARSPLHLTFLRQRPGQAVETGPLTSPRISREQLHLWARADGTVRLRSVGRCPLRHEGVELEETVVRPGDLLELGNEAVFLVTRRPGTLPPPPAQGGAQAFPFGIADPGGMVGESPAAWDLRLRVAFAARRDAHVLILGESGTGKELVARALHAQSERAGRALVSRSAATFPEGLLDAELFGNVRGFPNPGMAERPGLVGEADGSTLFLDELGELPQALQAHLLRLMDQGEYQRLGEARLRRADVRLVAATNRALEDLKHDLAPRFALHLKMPDLNARREDIPLLARHLLRALARRDADIAQRFFPGGDAAAEPRVTPALIGAVVRHRYTTHVRELAGLLWQAMGQSTATYLDAPEGLGIKAEERPAGPVRATVRPAQLTREQVEASLARHGGVVDRAWQELALPNRFALYRLIKKYGLRPAEAGEADGG